MAHEATRSNTVFEGEDLLADRVSEIAGLWKKGEIVPYLGCNLFEGDPGFPVDGSSLGPALSGRVTVPGRLKGKVHEIAQYIESQKHRKTLLGLMEELFRTETPPAHVHRLLQEYPVGLVVDAWYSTISSRYLVEPGGIQISAVSRAEDRERWFRTERKTAQGWEPVEVLGKQDRVLYRPFGTMLPETRVLVSDADFVEVLTEIDIQTPLPAWVREYRTGRHFLFLGCRFDNQTARIFARQIMKRSSDRHFAVVDGQITPKEQRFFEREGIEVLPLRLNETFLPALSRALGSRSGEI